MPHVIRSHWPPVVSLAVGLALLLWFVATAKPHDSWISTGGHKNAAGEWCCGEGDCFVLDPAWIEARADGYHIVVRPLDWVERTIKGEAMPPARNEIVPYAETQPSPDGAYWRCKRPDGSRRCFFAPPPNT
jgi:hypothetical protein